MAGVDVLAASGVCAPTGVAVVAATSLGGVAALSVLVIITTPGSAPMGVAATGAVGKLNVAVGSAAARLRVQATSKRAAKSRPGIRRALICTVLPLRVAISSQGYDSTRLGLMQAF